MEEDHSFVANAVVFKGDERRDNGDDPYVTELMRLSLNAKLIPVLKFEFFNLDNLKELLCSPNKFSGIVFSSPRCVRAVEKCMSFPLSEWSEKKMYVVGGKTAELVRALGFVPLGEHCGNADLLSKFILQEDGGLPLPLLIPQGNLSLKTLNNNLSSAGIKVHCIEVYRTLPNPTLDSLIQQYVDQFVKMDFVVFMSPSAVKYCLPLLASYQELSTINFISLGPSTGVSLQAAGIVPAGIAEKPTPTDLADAVSKVLSDLRKR